MTLCVMLYNPRPGFEFVKRTKPTKTLYNFATQCVYLNAFLW